MSRTRNYSSIKDNDAKVAMFKYLDDLRDSGARNMYGVSDCLKCEFGISLSDARKYLQEWMADYDKYEIN